MSEQAAGKADALTAEIKPRQQIVQNVVIVSGVESDLLGAAGLRERSNNVDGLVAIERCNLDRDDVLDLKKLSPEFIGQIAPADRGLQVETDDRDDRGNGASVFQKFCNGFVFQIGQAEQHGVVSQTRG